MERLTKSGAISGKDINELLDESNENQMGKTKAYYKLQEYEDLDEQNRLIRLPFKAGETLWLIMICGIKDKKAEWNIYEAICTGFSCCISGELKVSTIIKNKSKYRNEVPLSEIGETVFLTKSEAEIKLKKLRGKENESSN